MTLAMKIRDVTVGRLLTELAGTLPDREALVYADRRSAVDVP